MLRLYLVSMNIPEEVVDRSKVGDGQGELEDQMPIKERYPQWPDDWWNAEGIQQYLERGYSYDFGAVEVSVEDLTPRT